MGQRQVVDYVAKFCCYQKTTLVKAVEIFCCGYFMPMLLIIPFEAGLSFHWSIKIIIEKER